jgi:hypothetical protein
LYPITKQGNWNSVARLIAIKRHRKDIALELLVVYVSNANEAITRLNSSEIASAPIHFDVASFDAGYVPTTIKTQTWIWRKEKGGVGVEAADG